MTLAITEDHRLLAETARSLLERQGGTAGARQAAEGGSEKLASGWDELVGVGWLGLHVGEDVGGQGYGLQELAVVLYELGRVVGPGAFLPSVWAAAVVEKHGSEAQRSGHLPDLVTGRRIGAVGLAGRIAREDSSLTGDCLVLGGLWADLLVLTVGADIALVDRHADGVSVSVGDGLDRSQPLTRVELDRVTLDEAMLVPGVASHALDLGRVLSAAEAAGGARACTDLATAYAKERRQFGRVIGSFQAVKHHLANMLVDSELAAAAAWDAARSDTADRQQELCAAHAALLCLPAYVRNAKTSIQVHGGIGFTWEHDAHLYLRRATALAALFTTAPDPADQAVELARAGVRRSSDVELPAEAEEFRREVRAFRDDVVGLEPVEQRRRLVESGYLVPHWPRPWGRDAGPVEQLVIDDELAGSVTRPGLGISGWVTLTIAQHGTPDQLERWVGPSLAGELEFCQLFSEPEAGSDAAAVKTSGTRVDGGWIVNGQKVWTSGAHLVNRGLATVRTDPSASKHEGVTMMVVDMKAAGVDIRPLRQITGESHFNEVFFTDVFVPDDDVVGGAGQGWTVARATLGNERVSIGGGPAFAAPASDLAREATARWASELGPLLAEEHALHALVRRMVTRAVVGAGPGPEGNVTKLVTGEHTQRVTDLSVRMGGYDTVAGRAPAVIHQYLGAVCLTIAGGTSEIIRSQIGERILGLPREPNLR